MGISREITINHASVVGQKQSFSYELYYINMTLLCIYQLPILHCLFEQTAIMDREHLLKVISFIEIVTLIVIRALHILINWGHISLR